MAHFAKLGVDNIVLDVVVVNNVDTMTPQGVESEAVGVEFLTRLLGHAAWKKTSYTGTIRKNFAGIGYTYDSARDAFIPPKPFASWVLDEATCVWQSPVPMPTDGAIYRWNEETQAWDAVV